MRINGNYPAFQSRKNIHNSDNVSFNAVRWTNNKGLYNLVLAETNNFERKTMLFFKGETAFLILDLASAHLLGTPHGLSLVGAQFTILKIAEYFYKKVTLITAYNRLVPKVNSKSSIERKYPLQVEKLREFLRKKFNIGEEVLQPISKGQFANIFKVTTGKELKNQNI